MPPRRKFNKDNSTTFNVVHRAQNDPLIHDSDANQFVLAEKTAPRRAGYGEDDNGIYPAGGSQYSGVSYRSYKVKQRDDLESEFGGSVRQNEGEAAQHGVFYDDTSYDYMQHMKDLGTGEGASTFVPANAPKNENKKGKQSLVDALRNSTYDNDMQSVGQSSTTESIARSLFPEEVLPSEFVTKRSYQDQQDIPDEIAGFQPDMDPRLREVLEALEDEEYVDDEEDIFAELTKEGYEVDRDEWDLYGEQHTFDDDEEDAGWESDDTIKAASPSSSSPPPSTLDLSTLSLTEAAPPEDPLAVPPADPTHGAWLEEFEKFKAADKKSSTSKPTLPNGRPAPSALESSILSSMASGRRKKRKGAQTSTTNYSMTSSALARTAPLTLLDDRFDKIENAYSLAEFPEEEEDAYNDSQSLASGMTGASRVSKAYSTQSGLSGVSGVSSYSRAEDEEAPNLVRSDFDGIMDEFLGGHNKAGKFGKRIRKGKTLTGMQQLDEVRGQLGPARREGRVAEGMGR